MSDIIFFWPKNLQTAVCAFSTTTDFMALNQCGDSFFFWPKIWLHLSRDCPNIHRLVDLIVYFLFTKNWCECLFLTSHSLTSSPHTWIWQRLQVSNVFVHVMVIWRMGIVFQLRTMQIHVTYLFSWFRGSGSKCLSCRWKIMNWILFLSSIFELDINMKWILGLLE